MPKKIKQNTDSFRLVKKTVFTVNDPSLEKVASFFAAKIKNSTGYVLEIKSTQPQSDYINLIIAKDISVNDEGYLLDVTAKGVDITAKTPQGAFYAMQTLMQLFPAEIASPTPAQHIAWLAPTVNIEDEPRFKYRGQHLDVCRHFSDVDYIKKHLDVLAMFKINKFHWHLTEDQAWRIEIKKYPKLTELGAKRVEGDGTTDGPFFYTQDQVKEIVAYAKERFIDVIPEIELPGHGVAALVGYPEYSCTGGPFEVRNIWGVANDVYCAGNDSTFQFLTDIIEEVVPLFESEYFHVGGDECPKDRWKACSKCQARIKELGLKGDKDHSAEEKLQSYFVQRMEKVLLKHNKKMIGWDEILEGGLAPSATVMSWRGEEGGIAAANMGHDVIMTPGGWLYLDKYQGDSKLLPVTIGGYATIEKVYGYEPIPDKIAEDKKHHILGAQANVWAEYMYDSDQKENMTYPRILAVAELNWTPKEKKDYKDFERRLNNQLVRLDLHNVNYHIPLPEDKNAPSCNFVAFTDTATIDLKTTMPLKMVYTTDGSEPTLASTVYESPLAFTENKTIKVRTVLLSEKMGEVRTIELQKQSLAPAIQKVAGEKTGLKAEYFKGLARKVSELEGKTPNEIEYISSPQKSKNRIFDYKEFTKDELCSTILTGYINIPEDGVYYFSTDSEMWIDGKLLITNETEKDSARRFSRSDKSIALAKGLHAIKIVRLGAVFGGWPSQWEEMSVWIRSQKSPNFVAMSEVFFK
jgi:hexosaminidase